MGLIVFFFIKMDTSATIVFEKQWERDLFIGISIGVSTLLVHQSGLRMTVNSFFRRIFSALRGIHILALGFYMLYLVIRLLITI